MSDKLGSVAGARQDILMFDCSLPEPSLIWLLSGQEVSCGICNILGTMSKHSRRSQNFITASTAASSSVCSFRTTRTLTSDVLYFLSLPPKLSAASPDPSWVNSSRFNYLFQNFSMRCCTILETEPITQLGSSSFLSWPCSVCSSFSSALSAPSLELA